MSVGTWAQDRFDAETARDRLVDLVPGEAAIGGDVEVVVERRGLPNRRTNGSATSTERVSVHSDEPSPATITGFPAIIRRMAASGSPTWIGMPVRTVWLGRTIV